MVQYQESAGFEMLDSLDLQLIRLLHKDARRPQSDLAQVLGVSNGTIKNRLNNLMSRGLLKIQAIADPSGLGFPTQVLIAISARLGDLKSVEKELAKLEEVLFAYTISGRFDFLISCAFRNDAHLRDFLVDKLSKIKAIQDTETLHVLNMMKRSWEWEPPLGKEEEARSSEVPRIRAK